MDFTGKVAVVTGARVGIGNAVASKLARLGACVVLVSREGAEGAAADLVERGWNVVSQVCDVSAENNVRRMVEDVCARHGRIDILVNNAAVSRVAKIEDISLEEWNRVLATNLTGCFLCCRHVAPVMKSQRSGKIVNVSSIAGRFRSPVAGIHYVASKAGILGFTRQLAYELSSFGINVNAVCPSQTLTPLLESSMTPEQQERLAGSIPLGRIASAEEQANVIAFLASDQSSYMTGSIVDVNGGQW